MRAAQNSFGKEREQPKGDPYARARLASTKSCIRSQTLEELKVKRYGAMSFALLYPFNWVRNTLRNRKDPADMDQQQRLSEYPQLSTALMDYGWFLPPGVAGHEHKRIKNLVTYITANPPADNPARQAIEVMIHRELLDVAFSNELRARYMWLALRTPHIQKYSHLYESAIFAYYKREYSATVCLLLATLEGVLLSLNGWSVGQPNKPSFSKLTATVSNLALASINPVMDAVQVAFRDALSQFISRWLYSHTSNADFSLSVLNRHYVLHGMDAGNFYRPQDVHRLLFGFDLLIDLVGIINGTYRSMIDTDDDIYERRQLFYEQLQRGALAIVTASEREQTLLKEHPNYAAPLLEACEELRINR